LRVPLVCQDAAILVAQWDAAMRTLGSEPADDPEAALNTILATDAIRKPQRFVELLQAYALLLAVRSLEVERITSQMQLWQRLFEAVMAVDAGVIAKSCGADTGKIKEAVYAARLDALKNALIN
ncbi:MAG TPA: hypothetical protein VFD12_08875, partial [Oligella sp.]|nr:hypothetical protein [Oligella sp.]